MAGKVGRPLGAKHTQLTRERIQVTKLIDRLQDFVDGKDDISRERLKAIEILLKKSLPDLSSVELTGDGDNPVAVKGVINLVRPPGS